MIVRIAKLYIGQTPFPHNRQTGEGENITKRKKYSREAIEFGDFVLNRERAYAV